MSASPAVPDITVVILSYNEAVHIGRCIDRVRPIARRIVVIDSVSTDGTQEIARSHGAEVVERPFTYHADQLRWGMEQAGIDSEWILWLSCDEYLQPGLLEEIRGRLATLPETVGGVEMKLRVVFQGKWIRWGGYYRTVLVRLWRRGCAEVEEKLMDERMVVRRGDVVLFTGGDLVDENLKDIAYWTDKHNGYSTKHMVQFVALEYRLFPDEGGGALNKQGRVKRFLRDTVYAGMPLYVRPVLFFILRYFLRLGFLDGRRGFVWHALQGFWHYLLIDVKVGEARRYIRSHGMDAFRAHLAERYRIDLQKLIDKR